MTCRRRDDVGSCGVGGKLMPDETNDCDARLELLGAVGRLDLPVALIDLEDLTVRAVSQEVEHLGLAGAKVGDLITDLWRREDRSAAAAALRAMHAGFMDFYRAQRVARDAAPDRASGVSTIWVRALHFGDHRMALAEATAGPLPESPLARFVGHEPLEMAVGLADANWIISSVSCEITALIGAAPSEVIGQRLLTTAQQRELGAIVAGTARDDYAQTFAVRILLLDSSGAKRPLCLLLTSSVDPSNRMFILLPDPGIVASSDADRVAELERHLWRIAAEVDASGVLQRIAPSPDLRRFPQLQGLTVRQWEVLSRLLRGERVPTIATELFVSQSTIRNHLSAIFDRFGVHSQPELLTLPTPVSCSPKPQLALTTSPVS